MFISQMADITLIKSFISAAGAMPFGRQGLGGNVDKST
jgi:hypothetical protein